MSRLNMIKYKWVIRSCKFIQIFLAILYLILLFLSFYLNDIEKFNKLFLLVWIYQITSIFYCAYYIKHTERCINKIDFIQSQKEVLDPYSGFCVIAAFIIPLSLIMINFRAFRSRGIAKIVSFFLIMIIMCINNIFALREFAYRFSDIQKLLSEENNDVK